MIIKKIGQSSVEYVVLVIVVMGAMLVGGVYVKRGIQGRWKASVDEVGDQYDPAYMNTQTTHFLVSNTETRLWTVPAGGNSFWTMREDISNTQDTQSGYIRVGTRP
jgi:hypothetical protein